MTAPVSHTPWSYRAGPSLHGRYHTVEDAEGEMVCECYDGEDARNEQNARLIAAAPDLLAALAALVLMIDAGGDTLGSMRDARAAIAKAAQ